MDGESRDEGTTDEGAQDTGEAAARRSRFGTLPEPVRLADTVEERPATRPDPARDAYDPNEWLVRYCL
ncbi:hypothetical protein ABZ915_46310 [Streptomyces sp. NPDC046915]|uniref:hypothetical protein n=1 Tax=Streptomyces sp. NPDC046915 TaxID=3155257 RepID=UPI0033FA4330